MPSKYKCHDHQFGRHFCIQWHLYFSQEHIAKWLGNLPHIPWAWVQFLGKMGDLCHQEVKLKKKKPLPVDYKTTASVTGLYPSA